jgi:transposase
VLEKKITCIRASQDLGIGRFIHFAERWVSDYKAHGANNAFPGSGNLRIEDEERRQLKREMDVLRRERNILKKALAIFSSS